MSFVLNLHRNPRKMSATSNCRSESGVRYSRSKWRASRRPCDKLWSVSFKTESGYSEADVDLVGGAPFG